MEFDASTARLVGDKQDNSGFDPTTAQLAAPAKPALSMPEPAQPAADSGDGDFMRGLKRTLPELKQLAGGTLAAAGDVTGWDGLRDYGLGLYKRGSDSAATLTKPTDSATEAWKQVKQGNIGAGVDFLQNAAGYTAGQALESLAASGAGALAGSEVPIAGNIAGAIGGLVAKGAVKKAVLKMGEEVLAKQLEKGVAKEAAEKTAQAATTSAMRRIGGAAFGTGAYNEMMELGSIYPDALQNAKDQGRDLTGIEKARAVGASLAAAGVESAADLFNLGVIFRGTKNIVGDGVKQGIKQAVTDYAGRAAVAAGEGALREGSTEAVQTGIERFGAGQSMTDADALRDYIDSAAVGAVGGVLFGAAAGAHHGEENQGATDQGEKPKKKSGVPIGQDPADGLRADVMQAMAAQQTANTPEQQAAAEKAFGDAHGKLVDYLEQHGRMLPSDNTIQVAPTRAPALQGDAVTAQDQFAQTLRNQDTTLERTAVGLTPDVNAARIAHPAAVPNASPVLRFPTASPGSLSDAANVLPQSSQAARPAADDAGFRRRLAETRAASQLSMPTAPTQGSLTEAAQEVTRVAPAPAPAAVASDERPATPPANLDPASGELLSIDAPNWPNAAEHQQPSAIVGSIVAAAMQKKNRRPSGVSEISQTYNVDEKTARALRSRAVSTMTKDWVQQYQDRVSGASQDVATADDAGEEATAPPRAADEVPAARAAQDLAPAAREEVADGEEAGASASPPVESRAQDMPTAAESGVYDDSPEMQDDDVGAPSGGPFTIDGAARQAAASIKGGRVVPVDGGFVVRTPRTAEAAPSISSGPAPAAPEANPTTLAQSHPDQGTGETSRSDHHAAGETHDATPASTIAQPVHASRPEDGQIQGEDQVAPTSQQDTPAAPVAEQQPAALAAASATHEDPGEAPSEATAAVVGASVRKSAKNTGRELAAARAALLAQIDRAIADAPDVSLPVRPKEPRPLKGQFGPNHALNLAWDAYDAEIAKYKHVTFDVPGDGKFRVVNAKARLTAFRGQVEKSKGFQATGSKHPVPSKPSGNLSERARQQVMAEAERVPEESAPPKFRARATGMPIGGFYAVGRDGAALKGKGRKAADKNFPRRFKTIDEADAWARKIDPDPPAGTEIDTAAHSAATSPRNDLAEPSDAQKDAGNYAMGHARVHGLDISIENPRGSKRRPEWPALAHHYGYIRGTVGKDKDHVDVFLTDHAQDPDRPVFVVDQVNKDGGFDEHKVVLGAADEAEARKAYLDNYTKGWTGLGAITRMSMDEFKAWVKDSKKTKRPAGKLAKRTSRPAPQQTTTAGDNQHGKASDNGTVTKSGEPQGQPLFRRGEAGGGLGFDRALQLKAQITGKWGENAPQVVLVQDAEGFPASAKVDPDYRRAEGFYNGNPTVWINVGGIRTEERFAQVLAHEALGHYGVERVVGTEQWNDIVASVQRLEKSGATNERIGAVLRDVRQRYGDVDKVTFAKEVIAVLAERGIRNSWVSRVVAAVRRFLRANGFGAEWNERDLLGLLSQSESFLRAGQKQATSRGLVAAGAFSRERGPLAPDAETADAYRVALQKLVNDRRTLVQPITVGRTPVVMQMLGTPALPITIDRDTIRKATNGVKHNVPMDVIERLPELLTDPQAVFDSRSDGGFAILVDAQDKSGRPVIVAMHVRRTVRALEVNRIASAYGKDDAASRFAAWTEQGLLHYVADKQNPDLVRLVGLRSSVSGSPDQGSSNTAAAEAEKNPDPVRLMGLQSPASGSPNRGSESTRRPADVAPVASKSRPGEDSARTVLSRDDVVKYADDTGAYSRAPVQLRVAANGERSMELGGETFVQRGPRFYMVNGTGHPKDFATMEQAREAARRTGAEAIADPVVDGEARTYSVVAPSEVARTAELPPGHGPIPGLFSKPSVDSIMSIEHEVQAVSAADDDQPLVTRLRQRLADATPAKLKDALRGSWLGALATRHLTELGSDYFPDMRIYSDLLAEQAADRNKLQADAETLAEGARKWAGKNQPAARALFQLMHETTIQGVDPSVEYQPGLLPEFAGERMEATPKNLKAFIKSARQQMRERSGDSKVDMLERVKAARQTVARERGRRESYAPLVNRWNALPKEAQQIYRDFRDAYAARSKMVEDGLVARINDSDAAPNEKRRLVTAIRMQFENQRLQGVYFPLQRFGRYFVSAEKDDTPAFLMFERLDQLERAVKDLKKRGFTVRAQGLKSAAKAKNAPSGTFVADIITALDKAGVSDKTQDEIYQIYLETLPEMSMRKHSIHRQSVPGFDPDAIRAFAFNMTHGAHQIARLRYGHKLQNVLDMLKREQDDARRKPTGDTRKIVAGDAIIDELSRRHDWINNPQDSQLTNLISSAGFIYYLGLTPAAALVNLTQTAMISYPYLASRFGGVKAMNHLLAGMRDAVRTVGNIQKTLTDPDERRAYQVLQSIGAIEKTQAHNLAGIAEGGLKGYNPAWSKAMEIIGWGFHKTEVVNREATGMAAYRLARAEGKTFDQAVRFASDTIWDTHFDYSNANRARFMQSGTAKVMLMFRQYSLNMTWHLARLVWNATKGESADVKRVARRNLAGVLGMSALFSGALGLPMMGVITGILNSVASSAGDGDEPWDAETELRAFLSDMLGTKVAETLLTGVANQVTGADIASRVGLSDMWIRDADRELDGRDYYYNLLEQAAGPMGGVLKNALVGKQMMDEGHLMRGVETVLPKSLKDVLKAARYATQGVNNLRGDPILADPSVYQALLQVNGFTPNQVAYQYDINRSLKNYEQAILDRRQRLMDAYAMASRLGDTGAMQDVMEQVQAFNEKNREIAITPKSIKASLRSRARYTSRAENGIVLNPKIAARVRDAVGVE